MGSDHRATLLAVDADGELAATIESLYAAFANVPRPPVDVIGLTPADSITPLRELSAAALDPFARRALTTMGNTDGLRWATPRLVELSVFGGGGDPEWPEIEQVLAKLGYDGPAPARPWWTWPAAECAAIRAVLLVWWRVVLSAEVDDDVVDRVLCAIGCCEPDLDPFLDVWLRPDRSARAATHLLAFVDRNASLSHTGRLWNSFWTTRSGPATTNRDRVIAWLAQFR